MRSIRRWGLALGAAGLVLAAAGCGGSSGHPKAPVKTTGAPATATGDARTGGAAKRTLPGGVPNTFAPGSTPAGDTLKGNSGRTLPHYGGASPTATR